MRRAHRRFHVLLWVVLAAGVIGAAVVILGAPKPDAIETYKPSAE